MSVNRGLSDSVNLSTSLSIMTINMGTYPVHQPFSGYISLIRVHCTVINGSPAPTSINLSLFEDTACTIAIATNDDATIDLVDGDTTKGNAVFALNCYVSADNPNIYAKVKTNNGTCTAQIRIDWEGER